VRFLKATVIGGALFLVPIVVLLGILGKAFEFFRKLTVPLAEALPETIIAGIPTPRLLAFLAIVLFCFLAGLFARTALAKRAVAWVESALLSNIPGYTFMKNMGESVAGVQGKNQEVVLARIEDAWQIAFVVERMQQGHVAVYVPGAPNPWSGSVYLMTEDRIKPLEVPTAAAMKVIKGLGLGADKLTQGRL
jgi:uncharacterized membrane protein